MRLITTFYGIAVLFERSDTKALTSTRESSMVPLDVLEELGCELSACATTTPVTATGAATDVARTTGAMRTVLAVGRAWLPAVDTTSYNGGKSQINNYTCNKRQPEAGTDSIPGRAFAASAA